MEKEKSQILAFEKASNDKARAVYIGTNYTTDDDLIGAAALGNMDAMDSLIRKYNESFRKTALIYIKNPDMVDDLMQDSYIRMVNGIKNFKGDSSFYTWGRTIIRNTAFDMLKLNKKHSGERYGLVRYHFNTVGLHDEDGSNFDEKDIQSHDLFGINPEIASEASDIINKITQIVKKLKEDEEEMLLNWIEGTPYDRLAEINKIPTGTAKSRISAIQFKFKRNPVLKQYMS